MFCVCSLTAYAIREGGQQNIPESIQLFDIFSEQISEVVKVNNRINFKEKTIFN